MLAPVRTIAPAGTPVSLNEAKLHLRVDHTDDDTVITALIAAAVDYLDGWTGILGRALVKQTWQQDFAGFGCLRLQVGPVTEVKSITYFDGNNQPQTLPETAYVKRSDARGSYVDLPPHGTWPTAYFRPDAVSVTYEAGTAPADVPAAIKIAIMLMVRDLYVSSNADGIVKRDTVEGVSTVEYHAPTAQVGTNPTVSALLAPFRRVA